MPRKLLKPFLLMLAVLMTIGVAPVRAGVSGKVSGEVYDSRTGEPLAGATVRVAGTNLGTKTDDDGEYFIINVPVGTYDLMVTSVGYESITKAGVRVLVDLTTPVDFEVEQKTVELGQEVVVYATNPIIKRDLTESKVIFTADRLRSLPNISTITSVLTNYPGVVTDRNQNLHVRGGRSGEVAYYYDGFPVQDPFFSTAGIRIMPTALEELSLTSGGYTAEYGEALSGVISAVTREGTDDYRGSVRFYEGATHRYDVKTAELGNLDFNRNRSLSASFSGPIPGMNPQLYTFFAAGEYRTSDTWLPHNDFRSYTGATKLSLRPSQSLKVKLNGTYYKSDGEFYDHRDGNGRSYDFNLDGLPVYESRAYLVGLTGTYNLSERMILSAAYSRFRTWAKVAPEHLMDVYWSQWPGYSVDEDGVYNGSIHDDNYLGYYDASDPYQVSGFTVGSDFEPTFNERVAEYDGAALHTLAQISKTHQLKAGLNWRRYDLDWDFKQFYNSQPYGEKYVTKPMLASGFLQDKMEYDDFVINAGIRFDYRDADAAFNATPQDTVAVYETAESKFRISPRLGVSFPISEKSVMHFNYGFYYQEPQYDYMYTNLQGDITTGRPLLGNPNLDPEETTAYEIGLDHLIGDRYRIDITAYYKDIEDLVTTRSTYKVAGQAVTFYTNGDYGSVKGIDIALEKLAVNSFLSGSVSYGYMIATGNGSFALEPYYTYLASREDTLAPVGEYPLDFDQRHTVTAVLSYDVPRDWHGRMLGVPVPNAWNFSLVGHYGSGLPYTQVDAAGNRLGERNEVRLPATYTVDARFSKGFFFGPGQERLNLFVEVDNLFNRRNIVNVYARTGQPDNDGIRQGAGLSLNQQELDQLDYLFDHDPQNFSPPRTVRIGAELNF